MLLAEAKRWNLVNVVETSFYCLFSENECDGLRIYRVELAGASKEENMKQKV